MKRMLLLLLILNTHFSFSMHLALVDSGKTIGELGSLAIDALEQSNYDQAKLLLEKMRSTIEQNGLNFENTYCLLQPLENLLISELSEQSENSFIPFELGKFYWSFKNLCQPSLRRRCIEKAKRCFDMALQRNGFTDDTEIRTWRDSAAQMLQTYEEQERAELEKKAQKLHARESANLPDYYLQIKAAQEQDNRLKEEYLKRLERFRKNQEQLNEALQAFYNGNEESAWIVSYLKKNEKEKQRLEAEFLSRKRKRSVLYSTCKRIMEYLIRVPVDELDEDHKSCIYWVLGELSIKNDEIPQAIEYFRQAAIRGNQMSQFQLGKWLYKLGNFREAIDALQLAIEYKSSQNCTVEKWIQAMAFIRLRQPEKAAPLIGEVLLDIKYIDTKDVFTECCNLVDLLFLKDLELYAERLCMNDSLTKEQQDLLFLAGRLACMVDNEEKTATQYLLKIARLGHQKAKFILGTEELKNPQMQFYYLIESCESDDSYVREKAREEIEDYISAGFLTPICWKVNELKNDNKKLKKFLRRMRSLKFKHCPGDEDIISYLKRWEIIGFIKNKAQEKCVGAELLLGRILASSVWQSITPVQISSEDLERLKSSVVYLLDAYKQLKPGEKEKWYTDIFYLCDKLCLHFLHQEKIPCDFFIINLMAYEILQAPLFKLNLARGLIFKDLKKENLLEEDFKLFNLNKDTCSDDDIVQLGLRLLNECTQVSTTNDNVRGEAHESLCGYYLNLNKYKEAYKHCDKAARLGNDAAKKNLPKLEKLKTIEKGIERKRRRQEAIIRQEDQETLKKAKIFFDRKEYDKAYNVIKDLADRKSNQVMSNEEIEAKARVVQIYLLSEVDISIDLVTQYYLLLARLNVKIQSQHSDVKINYLDDMHITFDKAFTKQYPRAIALKEMVKEKGLKLNFIHENSNNNNG